MAFKLSATYRKERFKKLSGSCSCNDVFVKDLGTHSITIRYTKCRGGSRQSSCPVEILAYKGRELIKETIESDVDSFYTFYNEIKSYANN